MTVEYHMPKKETQKKTAIAICKKCSKPYGGQSSLSTFNDNGRHNCYCGGLIIIEPIKETE